MHVNRISGATKAEALKEERRLLSMRDSGCAVPNKDKAKFNYAAQIFHSWITERERQGKLAAGSARSYRYRLDTHLKPIFTGYNIQQITYDAMDRYISRRRQVGVKPATINREVATMKRLLSVAVLNRLIPANPLVGFEMLPEMNARDMHLTSKQVVSLLTECAKPRYPKHLYPIVVLALHTGLRREGCLTLRWEEIDWHRGEIKKKVKCNTEVRIPMTQVLREQVEAWRARDGVIRATGWVFPSARKPGCPMLTTSNFGFDRAAKAAGLRGFHFHDIRHTFATHFLEQFPDQIETLQAMMGHRSNYMTRRYAHITDKSRHATMQRFEMGG